MIVSFKNYELPPRYDETNWVTARIYESVAEIGPWNLIDTQTLEPQADPAVPDKISLTTDNATLAPGFGWYKINFLDAGSNQAESEPVFNPATTEIMASIDDINAHLDGDIVSADWDNTALIQISVARIVRGYLTRVVDQVVLMTWTTPDLTPEIVREAASMLIAAQLYFNETSRTSIDIENTHYAQKLYDAAMVILNNIINGTILLPSTVPVEDTEAMSNLDYFPVDATDRAFTLSQIF
jgi:hypothetical protein